MDEIVPLEKKMAGKLGYCLVSKVKVNYCAGALICNIN